MFLLHEASLASKIRKLELWNYFSINAMKTLHYTLGILAEVPFATKIIELNSKNRNIFGILGNDNSHHL
jgi:hypothetical protein